MTEDRRLPSLSTAARLLFWPAVAATLYFALTKHPPLVPLDDKAQHAIAFLGLTVLLCAAYPKRGWAVPVVGLGLFGAAIEAVQAIPSIERSADAGDWIVDAAAIAVTVAGIALLRRIGPIVRTA